MFHQESIEFTCSTWNTESNHHTAQNRLALQRQIPSNPIRVNRSSHRELQCIVKRGLDTNQSGHQRIIHTGLKSMGVEFVRHFEARACNPQTWKVWSPNLASRVDLKKKCLLEMLPIMSKLSYFWQRLYLWVMISDCTLINVENQSRVKAAEFNN